MVKADPEAEAALKGSQGLAKEPQPQAKSKKSRAKKRPIGDVEAESDSEPEPEPEYVPRKSRSRAVPMTQAVGL
jgi:hypothetical protein